MTLATLFDAQNGLCFYCTGKTWLGGRETKQQARARLGITPGLPRAQRALALRRATEEHLIRRADGGKRKGNLVMACAFCNSHRGETSVDAHKTNMLALVKAGKHPCFGVNPLAAKARPWRGKAPPISAQVTE